MRASTATARALDPAARRQHALDLAYGYLSRRDRTVLEVQHYLEGKKVDPELIDDALRTLRDQGYLDDARYAQRFCEDRRELDSWGSERIERRLRAAGVTEREVAAALDGAGAHDEIEAALALLRRRFPIAPADDRARTRALGILVRRGYELELAHDAIRRFEREG